MKETIKIKNIPFFESPDDNHCFQACLKMVLKYWLPKKNFTFKELNKLTGHNPKKWTWQGQSLIWLSSNGFNVVNIENLNYKNFYEEGENYLKKIWNKDVFVTQKKYSDLEKEKLIAGKLIASKNIKLETKDATFDDVEELLKNNFLVMVSINPYIIRGETGYSSHLVVITKITNEFVFFHDPGPPGKENFKINKDIFKSSMTKPGKEDTNVIGIKLREDIF